MTVFFTADAPFGHSNVIRYDKRPFSDVTEMNETPIRNWNCKHYGSWHLYGHSLGQLSPAEGTLTVDVGVDSGNYTPVSLEHIKDVMLRVSRS